MDEARFRAIAEAVAQEYQAGGLTDGIYYDFAREVCRRYLASSATGGRVRVEEVKPAARQTSIAESDLERRIRERMILGVGYGAPLLATELGVDLDLVWAALERLQSAGVVVVGPGAFPGDPRVYWRRLQA